MMLSLLPLSIAARIFLNTFLMTTKKKKRPQSLILSFTWPCCDNERLLKSLLESSCDFYVYMYPYPKSTPNSFRKRSSPYIAFENSCLFILRVRQRLKIVYIFLFYLVCHVNVTSSPCHLVCTLFKHQCINCKNGGSDDDESAVSQSWKVRNPRHFKRDSYTLSNTCWAVRATQTAKPDDWKKCYGHGCNLTAPFSMLNPLPNVYEVVQESLGFKYEMMPGLNVA